VLLARVAVPVPLGRAFTYSVPEGLQLTRGARVLCDFGKRSVLGVVLDVSDREPDIEPDKIRPVRSLVDSEPVLPEELLDFLIELGRYYLAPIGEVMRLALPAIERGAQRSLEKKVGRAVGRLLRVAHPSDLPLPDALRGKARELYRHLLEAGPTPVRDLSKRWKSARTQLGRLAELGLVRIEESEEIRDPFRLLETVRDEAPLLNADQARAVDAIQKCLDARERQAFLLHGVTGSGKTEVYLRAVGRVIEAGGSAIVLVPEIALTPQLVSRFRARLGERIAVLHSGLGEADRHAMWKSLRSGSVRVAIGARSALFAPVEDLRLVCVDEEHDGSFKQEEGVRYNARDMALLRAHRAGAVCLLGSATPSLASELQTREGRMARLSLPERARPSAVLPAVEIVDLRRTGSMPGGHRLLSVPLHRALEATLVAGEQAILFLNRRGFAPSLLCEECGTIAQCPNCAVALTLHRARRETLICHYCDHHEPETRRCAACKSDRLSEEGAGTERIETILKEAFPSARVARLDRDVASGQKSDAILTRMRERKIDILVGTQMVTKGHDLPAVTLVGVLNADAALSLPDFRAAERTFHLLVQVAGRAGRGEVRGRVLIQTWQPEHAAVRLAARHAVEEFVERELEDRKELRYPPYQRIALVRVDAVEDARARAAALSLATLVKKGAPPGVEIIGPAPAPLARLRNRFRHRFLVRSADRALLRQALLVAARAPTDRRIRMAIDIDPMSML
jgi:primosomal protein N' (replication factor Y)